MMSVKSAIGAIVWSLMMARNLACKVRLGFYFYDVICVADLLAADAVLLPSLRRSAWRELVLISACFIIAIAALALSAAASTPS